MFKNTPNQSDKLINLPKKHTEKLEMCAVTIVLL